MHLETPIHANRAMPGLHSLSIIERSQPTDDSLCLRFAVPQQLHQHFVFTEGQFIALEAEIDGERIRRNYSICSSVQEYEQYKTFSVGIRILIHGRFSNWARQHLLAGSRILVMTPDGRFVPPPLTAAADAQADALTNRNDIGRNDGHRRKNRRHHVAFAGGSGITPILSMIKTRLHHEPSSYFSLIYANRHSQSIMFLEELEDLKNQYIDRFNRIHVLSEERSDLELHHGVLDQAKCSSLLEKLLPPLSIDVAYICGPEPMMLATEAALLEAGVDRSRILIERFGSPPSEIVHARATPSPSPTDDKADSCTVVIAIDGKQRNIKVPRQGESILQAGLRAGMPLPFACQAAVCCTCRAKVLDGEVQMDKNYTLRAEELAQGFVLTCQAHPLSEHVVLSFDER